MFCVIISARETEFTPQKACTMIRDHSQNQLSLAGFESPFETCLDKNNRWIKLSQVIPWDTLSEAYYKNLSLTQGRPAKSARLVIGSVIIKHKLVLSDEETVQMIQENPYLQYFVGLPGFQNKQPFAPSLFVDIRKRMGDEAFDFFHQAIVNELEKKKAGDKKSDGTDTDGNLSNNSEEVSSEENCKASANQGKLIVDATVAEQAIKYPTDLDLLNECREISEKIIDHLYPHASLNKKPRTYRENARKDYLSVVKQRKASKKKRRQGLKKQLQYVRRNLGHIERLMDALPDRSIPLPYRLLRKYWIIQHVFLQQENMYKEKVNRCDDRIVSISQPYVRPIVRGKAGKSVEFGAKLNVSLTMDGLASIDQVGWDAFHEGKGLSLQVENYKKKHGVYPEVVLADSLYGTRENRKYLKGKNIRFAGKPLGRPKKVTEENKVQIKEEKKKRIEEYRQRIPIEGKFGQGKNGYRLNYIRAKTARTSEAWIRSIFLVMNLMVLIKFFLRLKKLKVVGCCSILPAQIMHKLLAALVSVVET